MFEPKPQARKLRRSLAAALLTAAWSLSACAPDVPAGRFSCQNDDDCPDGWACAPNARGDSRCFPTGSDGRAVRGSDQPKNPRDSGVDASDRPGEPRDSSTPPANTDAGPGVVTPDPTPPEAGSGGPAAGSGGSPATGSGGTSMPPPTAGSAPPPPTCQPLTPAAGDGVFVAPDGSDAEDCGSPESPCGTLERAMDRAQSTDRKQLFLAQGRYDGQLVLRPELVLRGGFEREGARWTRQCDPGLPARTEIASMAEIGVRAEYDGDAQLEALTISTFVKMAKGQSAYGIFARGKGTRLRLRDVHVIAASGGDGERGRDGAKPPQQTMSCVPGSDGADGVREGAPGAGAPAGKFDEDGYWPSLGKLGNPGEGGHNGATGTSTCRECLESCNPSTCDGVPLGESCGFGGAAGCGGVAGPGGAPGTGGGASIAVFAWAARVDVEGGSFLAAGNGGNGGPGGAGGPGGDGGEGASGTNGESCTVCAKGGVIPIDPPLPTDTARFEAAAGSGAIGRPIFDAGIVIPVMCTNGKGYGIGTAGTRGGKGTAGGEGGGGSGGHSYGVFAGGEARVELADSVVIQPGMPGRGAGTGAGGEAAPTKLLP